MLFALAMSIVGEGMDAERFSKIVDRHGQNILRVAYMYLKDRQRAEDICQEVFIRAYQSNKVFESEDHERSWLLRVTVNMCKDSLKSFWNKRIVLDDTKEGEPGKDTGDIVVEKYTSKKLLDCVMSLPETFKTVIILFYYEEMSSKEIAETLGIPEATVRSRLKRAREKLQNQLSL